MAQRGDDLLAIVGISKTFPGTQALKDIHLKVKKGEVHAFLGENGAGKSTLMKIIMGLLKADKGHLFFDGQTLHNSNPSQALNRGISMIHQELNPVPFMTIAENIFLHREPLSCGGLFINDRELKRQTVAVLQQFNLPLSPDRQMCTLTVAQMQIIEIIKAVIFNAKLVIMDEPTSSLDDDETQRLFKTIRELKAKGIAIIYISHRMEEIFAIADSVTVLRDGACIGSKRIDQVSKETLIAMMVGRELDSIFPKTNVPIGEVVLEVKNLTKRGVFHDISFQVHAGEILGFSGLMGAGRSEIMRAIFGLDKIDGGQVIYRNQALDIRFPAQAIRQGIAMVTEDRKEYGLVLCRSIKENIALPSLRTRHAGFFIRHQQEQREVQQIAQQFAIKATGMNAAVWSLSGGNQQKVVLSKWLLNRPNVIILDEPTRGIDVGAKSEIHRLMCRFAAAGMAILLISSELPEVMGMSDRVIVITEGRVNGEFSRADIATGKITQADILHRALGGKSHS